MYDPSESLRLLKVIWSRSFGGYVHLPQRISGAWVERPVKVGEVTVEHLTPNVFTDLYFSPLQFFTPGRKLSDCGSPGVLFADIDAAPDKSGTPPANIVWETSPGSRQAVWFLTGDTSDLALWRTVNRQLTYWMGADRGGWMENKVLRVPGSDNWKRADKVKRMPAFGAIQKVDTSFSYKLADLNRWLPAVPGPVTVTESGSVPSNPPPDLGEISVPMSTAYWLSMTPEQYAKLRKIDRSVTLWRVAQALKRGGVSKEAAFFLIKRAPWCKWKNNDEKLWTDITRAYSMA